MLFHYDAENVISENVKAATAAAHHANTVPYHKDACV